MVRRKTDVETGKINEENQCYASEGADTKIGSNEDLREILRKVQLERKIILIQWIIIFLCFFGLMICIIYAEWVMRLSNQLMVLIK